MELKFSRDNAEVDEIIDNLLEKAGGIHHATLCPGNDHHRT